MSKINSYLLTTVYCLLFFASCRNNSSEKTPAGVKINSAKNIFEENCIACHGDDGKLCAMNAKDLSLSTLNKTQMIEIIANGKSTMTPFGSMLSKEEIDAVTDYIQTLKK